MQRSVQVELLDGDRAVRELLVQALNENLGH
jgi:hypothetical protein